MSQVNATITENNVQATLIDLDIRVTILDPESQVITPKIVNNEVLASFTPTNQISVTISAGYSLSDLDTRYYSKAQTDSLITSVESSLTALDSDVDSHIVNTNNPHSVTKTQVGLSNVDNTADIDKPISTATQNALNAKSNVGHTHDDRYYTETEVDTLLTGKSAVGHIHDDRYYTETEIDSSLALKAPLGSPTFTGVVTLPANQVLTTPTIASFTNAQHAHSNAASGGQIAISNTTGTLAVNRGGTGRATSSIAYGIIAAGTTTTGAHQTIALGNAGQILKSNGAGALASFQTGAPADVALGNVTNDAQVKRTEMGAANGVATLGIDGKVPTSQLPAIGIVDVYTVNSQAAQLALSAQEGDVAIRTDLNKSYIHNGGTSGTMADWSELLTPTDQVLSVNGQTGAVTLTTSHITEGANLYYTEQRVNDNVNVAANTAARHTHSNKALLDTYTQTETNLADAVSKKHASGSDNQNLYDKVTDGSVTATPGSQTDTLKVRSANNRLSVAVGSNDPTHGDNILFTINEANFDLANLGGQVTNDQVPDTITLTNITQITNRSHTALSDIGTNTHAQIDSHIASTSNPHSVTKTQVGLGNVTNDSQVKRAEMGVADGVATLGSDGKVPNSQLPAIAMVDVYTVSSQAAQLALSAQEGDVAVRTDLNKSYIHNGGTAGTMADWTELLTPTDQVMSVNGMTGAVTLTTSHITEGSNLYYTDERVDDRVNALLAFPANQITKSYDDTNGVLTLSLPQNLHDAASPTFAGLTLSGDLAVNGGDITSTGALAITPAAESGLSVNLSGAGDFAVNTNQLYVDTSTGNVAIGMIAGNYALEVGRAGSLGHFSLSDPNIDHGMTGIAATNTFFELTTIDALTGGVNMAGFSDDPSTSAFRIRGTIGNASPTVAPLVFVGARKNGTVQGDIADASTLFQLLNRNTARHTVLGDGSLGITVTPAARLHVRHATLGNEVFRLESVATNDDPNYRVFQGRAATTNATVTTLNTVAIAASNTYLFEARIVGRRTSGTAGAAEDSAGYIIRGVYKTVAGVVTLVGALSVDYAVEDQAGWDATLTISGTNVLVQVTGALNNNITWHSTVIVQNLST